ncbi:MAG: HAMP domain-containing histidine kinase [Nitrospirae bacterium]|nr:HAMP domain-containing histidine kinase [Nitrospirota bacterium]
MKTKIFLAFLFVILAALLSNFIFEWLMMRDFDNYVRGVREDQFHWILTSVESSYSDRGWDKKALSESIHWSMMLGLDIKVLDVDNREVISSLEVMESLSETMRHRMEGLFHLHAHKTDGRHNAYPLHIGGRRIGTLLSRSFQKEELREKEAAFKKRTENFLLVSFVIAGGGLILIALLFSQYLSKPIMKLKGISEKIARGDFAVRTGIRSGDEVGKLSEAFDKMAESLQREEGLRKHLMSNIAHELRTPLTILKTHVEAIGDEIIDREKGLENIKNEIERLIKLVKGIEDITAAEASFFTRGKATEISLREFLAGLVNEMSPIFKEKGLDINITGKNDMLVTTDTEKLERVIRNMLSNSLKFTEKGWVRIDYGVYGNEFFIEIKDTGRGIPENEIPLIFNRFYRGTNKIPLNPPLLKGEEGGLGLGLAIVRELVEVMGGRIEVMSRLGEGTTFRIYFKLQQQNK